MHLPMSEVTLRSSGSDWSTSLLWAWPEGGGQYSSEIILDISCCSTLNTETKMVTTWRRFHGLGFVLVSHHSTSRVSRTSRCRAAPRTGT